MSIKKRAEPQKRAELVHSGMSSQSSQCLPNMKRDLRATESQQDNSTLGVNNILYCTVCNMMLMALHYVVVFLSLSPLPLSYCVCASARHEGMSFYFRSCEDL